MHYIFACLATIDKGGGYTYNVFQLGRSYAKQGATPSHCHIFDFALISSLYLLYLNGSTVSIYV
jgi:hypothetical protein